MAFSESDIQQSEAFLKLFCEAKWDNVTPERAVQIYKAIAWLQKMIEEMKRKEEPNGI